jgi:hypothetical protein
MSIRQNAWVWLLSGALALAAFAPQAGAEGPAEKTLRIPLNTKTEPKSVAVLFLSLDKAVQRQPSKVERINPDTIVASVTFTENEFSKDALVSAIAVSDKGEIVSSELHPLLAPDGPDAEASTPKCPPERFNEAAIQAQTSLIESIIETRLERRRLAQLRVAQVMNDEFVGKLRKMEGRFGLLYQKELSPDLPPVELIDRLSRILAVIEAMNSRKSQDRSASAAAGSMAAPQPASAKAGKK